MAEQLFEQYLHEVIRVMGSARRTSASELDRFGKLLLGDSFYRGAFAMSAEPPPDGTRHVLIINTTGPPGEHWMCLYRDPTSEFGSQMLYDSMGRVPSNGWQSHLRGIPTSDPDPEQPARYDNGALTEYCGQACLAFALVAKEYGWNTARHV